MKKTILMMATAAFFAAVPASMAAGTVSLPKGYEKWEKSKQQVVNDKKSLFYGIHYTYVNSKAMKTYKTKGIYPEGSMFVVVQYGIRQEGGKPAKGKKSMIVLMKKDKRYKETGGWLFAGYTPQGKPSGIDPVKNCYECHLKGAPDRDLVLSKYADFR
ncbi:MAG: cytochrome C [Deltaproteobacteria bacterium]|nr:cytochrome C [Deltaproteobacteria bacterium]